MRPSFMTQQGYFFCNVSSYWIHHFRASTFDKLPQAFNSETKQIIVYIYCKATKNQKMNRDIVIYIENPKNKIN